MTSASSKLIRTTATIAALGVLCSLAFAAAAVAGTYTVDGTCSAWTAFNTAPQRMASYPECPRLVARNIVGNFDTPHNTAGAGWRFDPPPGTAIRTVSLSGDVAGGESWSARVAIPINGSSEIIFADCTRQPNCDTLVAVNQNLPDVSAPIVASVRCTKQDGCPNSGGKPRVTMKLKSSQITLSDASAPGVAIAGGPLTDGGWHGHRTQVVLNASDNTGIRSASALVDGDARYSVPTGLGCDYSRPVPCSNHNGVTVQVDLGGLADGQHALAGRAEDASGNVGNSPAGIINVDNTAPVAPGRARLMGKRGFRDRNQFGVSWSNPPQQFAPIAGANYVLCPQNEPLGSPRCVSGTRSGPDLSRIDGVQVPGPGAWKLRFWLYDAAGNASPETGVTVGGLGLIAGRSSASGKGRHTRLTAGRRRGRSLKVRPRVKLGRPLNIRGRLTAGRGKRRRGLAGRQVLVYRRVQVQGARYKRVGQVTTGKRGRYKYRAGGGPSRRLQFVFAGGGKARGRIATVRVRVRARLKMRVDRHAVRNGESVALYGRLRGGKIPPSGALLELQVYSRGRWRPFATPRTDAKGRYLYRYPFQTVSGTVKFRFRAVLRRQATYPFTGISRPVKVRVRGL